MVVTDTSKAGQGVIAGAFSPDRQQLALVSNIGTLDFHLFLTKPDDFKLAHATALQCVAHRDLEHPRELLGNTHEFDVNAALTE